MTQLYRHFDRRDRLLYVGLSINAMHRGHGHKRKVWFTRVSKMLIENYPTKEAAMMAERVAITKERPLFNKRLPIVRPEKLPRPKSLAYTIEILIRIAKANRRNALKCGKNHEGSRELKIRAKRLESSIRYLKRLIELNYQPVPKPL